MKERSNKPRVFLSHSKRDVKFIKRLCEDLRRCQIDPWLDEYEIRHGQPWMDAIFEDGIPTCDAVVVYATENSITSPVVRKEIDAGILQTLQDNKIGFLPYVEDSTLRERMRSDLRTIQCPEWNSRNYRRVLPEVVAEIWRSHLERTVESATLKERVLRMDAELRVSAFEKNNRDSVFPDGETKDFEYIWSQLDRFEPVKFSVMKNMDGNKTVTKWQTIYINIGSLIVPISTSSQHVHSDSVMAALVKNLYETEIVDSSTIQEDEFLQYPEMASIANELLMYGLVTRFDKGPKPPPSNPKVHSFGHYERYALQYTEKLERFKYWLNIEGKMPEEIAWKTETEHRE